MNKNINAGQRVDECEAVTFFLDFSASSVAF